MTMRTLACWLLAASTLVTAAARGGPQPVFRSGEDLVRFDARVMDGSGRPIQDLRREELEIVENGQALPLLLFQHVSEPSGTYTEAALRASSAEVSTNRGAPRGRLYVLVFDQAHIAPGSEQVARRAAEAIITARVRPSDRIAVIGIPGPGPELGFTADRTRAIAELAKVQGEDASTRDSLQRLSDLLVQYRTVEGRKTVVFFSEGFDQRNVARELERVAAAAAQGHAVFYPFDLNRRTGTDIAPPLTPSTSAATDALARTGPLGSLAAETGGAMLTDGASHIDEALARIAEQSQDYYIVGFTPSAAALAARGEYRRVSVRVKRPGSRVSARTGYAAPKPDPPPDRRRAIDAAFAAPWAQQALRVEYTTYIMRAENAGRTRVMLSLEADLPLRAGDHASADVAFIVRDMRDGRVVASGADGMPLPEAAGAGAATGLGTYRVHFDVPPGAYTMRTVVREPGGLVGSADRKLDVRGVAGPDATVSDVILGSTTGPLPVRAHAFTQKGLSGMLEAYARSPAQLQALLVTVALVPAGSDQAIATMRADVGDAMSTGVGVMRRARFAFSLSSAAPGAYLVRVKVTAGPETIADLTRELEIVAGP